MAENDTDAQPKNLTIGTKVSEEQKRKLQGLAALRGTTVSALLREHSVKDLLKQAERMKASA